LRVWRLCRPEHAPFDGEGARLAGARWNRPGSAVVYTSQSLSLAANELFVHVTRGTEPSRLVYVSAEIPDRVQIRTVAESSLPRNWKAYPAPEALADLGTRWALARETAVLEVPSAVIPGEWNYLLNPAHADFARIRLDPPKPFAFDTRMWKARRPETGEGPRRRV
jgi:RES domain-containing protein